ncbi:MAG: ribonuclease R [Porticoccaceae bacterium]
MRKKHLKRDPHADREAARYEQPITSREYILSLLSKSVGPMTQEELCREFGMDDTDQIEALRRRLQAMVRDGQIVRNRSGGFGALDKMNVIKGRVNGHPEGFGFVITGSGEADIFLSSRQMRRVLSGDEVLVRIEGFDRKGRPEGSIVEVVDHRTQQLVGRYFTEGGIHFVRPDNPSISQDVLIGSEDTSGASAGQIVLVDITRQPSRNNQPAGRVSRVLGDHMAPGLEIEVAIHSFGIPQAWSEGLQADVDAIPDHVQEKDCEGRADLRHLPLVTIDGEDARDYDDAVYCEPVKGRGWNLYVAIADVSHYVKPGSELDREAYQRGNSVYFPDHVVPMLPEKLSNGLCSLKPEVDRLCMVCEMRIDTKGKIKRFQFYDAVLCSRARLTYTQVASMIAQRGDVDSGVRKQFQGVVEHVDDLYNLYGALHSARDRRGAIDFETGESRILFDAERKIEQIIPTERTDAHRLIEECMLAANECTAILLEKSKLPVLYRVHEGPKEEKLANLREFLGEIGLGLPGGDKPSPEDYQAVLRKIRERPDASIVQSVMLRSMSQAVYQPENRGHFGLNYEAYTHFTSPIRRYADLLVHRAIRGLLLSKRRVAHLNRHKKAKRLPLETSYPYDAVNMVDAGVQTSMSERRADDATRSVVNWLKCEYLVDHIGDEFAGIVTGVTGFGLFVELEGLYIDGLVHITGLPKDYYHHEPAHHRLVGERTRRVFRLGDRLQVNVARVDLEERKIDFELVETAGEKGSTRRQQNQGKAGPGKGGQGKGKPGTGKSGKREGGQNKKRRSRNTGGSTSGQKPSSKNVSGKKSPGKNVSGKKPSKKSR